MNNSTSKQIVINTLKNILYKFENEDENDNWEPGEKLKTIEKKLQMCNDCPGCGCCMFCGEGIINTQDFPIFQYHSVNNSIEQKQNYDLFDLEKEIKHNKK